MTYKKQLFCVLLLSVSSLLVSQNNYTVEGNTYTLNTEVEGTLTLLWNTIDGEYRYFSKKGNDIQELTNTSEKGRYQEEFKTILKTQTSDASVSLDRVNLTLPSLSRFFNTYNKIINPAFEIPEKKLVVEFRLGGFAGVTNSHFTSNPDNVIGPIFGAEAEITGKETYTKHALVMRTTYTPEVADYVYSATQASLNYRYKFIQKSAFDIFANAKFVSFTNFTRERQIDVVVDDGTLETQLVKDNGNNFQVSGILGLGADIKLGKGFLTLYYDDIIGLDVESNGEFPVNFTVGYKVKL